MAAEALVLPNGGLDQWDTIIDRWLSQPWKPLTKAERSNYGHRYAGFLWWLFPYEKRYTLITHYLWLLEQSPTNPVKALDKALANQKVSATRFARCFSSTRQACTPGASALPPTEESTPPEGDRPPRG